MPSKGYRRFKSRLDYFRTDTEIVEILVLNKELLKGTETIFKGVNQNEYPLLSNRTNSSNSRDLVVQHLRKTVYVALIKDMYEEVTEYLRYILREGAMNGGNVDRVGEHNVAMPANQILAKRDKKEIVQLIISQIFQQLEGKRSTINLITDIKNKLGLTIDKKLIEKALPYLEIRHILVHSDGKPDQAFLNKYPKVKIDGQKRISLDAKFAKEAYDSVNNLLMAIDKEMESKKYFSASELQGKDKC